MQLQRLTRANGVFECPGLLPVPNQAFAWGEMIATLRDLKAGRSAHIPCYDFVTSSRAAESLAVDSADIILFDGILAFYSAGTVFLPMCYGIDGMHGRPGK